MDYRPIIESRYNRENWQRLLHDIFGSKIKFWSMPSPVSTNSQFAKQALWLGTITLSDEQTISVYEVELSDIVDIERNRRGIRDMLLTAWRSNGNAGAFMFCYRKNESVLRFSYVSESWNFAEDGTYQKESTDTKRFTYLLGEGHRSRTAIQQFETLRDSALSLKDLTKAFSVDAVSDMFFKEYKKNYEDIIFYVTGKRMVKVANKWEEKQEGEPCEEIMQEFVHFPNPEKAIRDYVKKLMGRLVFLQFLQKKGWLGVPANAEWGTGDAEFIQNLFANTKDKDHFIDNVLEALFNDLNSENDKKLPQYRTPYLNGGLFERDASDETNFPLPAKYMQQMLDFFSSYNFTIDENDPDDAEVGVDPEMLGRIFENLLEDNKDKGAFYTPKEIVTYMCRESLIAYLQTDVEDEATKEAIRQFVTTHDAAILGNIADDIDQRLKDVKICDPAIGSGAFPMGLLKELFLCRTALEGIEQNKSAEIKKHIIQQNIYGVDIERGAVDIARLRFWLSLIVDEETPQALPNLDFKIMQGNSLLEQYKGVDLSTMTEITAEKQGVVQLTWFDNQLDVLRLNLREMLAKYYNCTNHNEKKQLRASIIENVKKQLKEQSINVDFGDLDLSSNNQFMLWHTWFYDVFSQGGFNIVIGNPPYVSAPNQIANPLLALQREKIIKSKCYKTLYQKWDLYIPFMEIGIDRLCGNNGTLTMIVPYPLTNQIYAEKIRKMMAGDNCIFKIVDLKGTKIFENATVDNCIPFVCKSSPTLNIEIAHINEQMHISTSYVKTISELLQDEQSQVWNLTQESRRTDRHSDLHVLGDFCYISKGMVLNADETTAKGEFKKEDLISTYKDSIHPRMYIEGKDLHPYHITQTRYLEYDTHRVPSMVSRPTFRELYERDKIMFNCLGTLKSMVDTGQHYLHNDSIICGMLWSTLSDVDNRSIDGVIRKYSSYNREELENLSNLVSLEYLLGLLNSKYANKLLCNLRGGGLRIYPDHIRNLPIPIANKDQQLYIESIVNKIVAIKNENPLADTTDLESEIDRLVYQLYGLTEEEIKIVEQS
jgi:hypothetical protein